MPLKGYKQTEEHRKKSSVIRIGHFLSDETKKKISLSKKGTILSDEHKKNIGNALRGKCLTPEHKKKISIAKVGTKMSDAQKKILSECKIKNPTKRFGKENHFWKGGVTSINSKIRESWEYRQWRKAVFIRDNWTCVFCKKRGVELNADHIKPFSLFPELRTELSNGRTLCVSCHRKTDTFGRRKQKINKYN